jgi:hypothetical protein
MQTTTTTPTGLARWINGASAALATFNLDADGYPADAAADAAADDLDEFVDHVAGHAIETFGLDTEDYETFYAACEKKGGLARPQKPIDWTKAPPAGTYALTAWLMAQGGDEDDGDFWDDWKDEMKERGA